MVKRLMVNGHFNINTFMGQMYPRGDKIMINFIIIHNRI
jgi:hypothetical protein